MADTQANMDRLQAVLAAYGADPARWPESDRELAPLLAAADPSLTTSLENARSLDAALAHASRPVAPAAAAQRLVARASMKRRATSSPSPRAARNERPHRARRLSGRLAVAASLAASLALGIYLGASGQSDWLTPPLLAEESPEYMSAELDVLDGTLQLFEDHTDP
jgi:hypothetical protein